MLSTSQKLTSFLWSFPHVVITCTIRDLGIHHNAVFQDLLLTVKPIQNFVAM